MPLDQTSLARGAPRSRKLRSLWVLVVGACLALGLAGAAWLDLGDPGVAALDRQTAEARSIGELSQARWKERLRRESPVAEALATLAVEAPEEMFAASPLVSATQEDELDALRLVGALGAPDLNSARTSLAPVLARAEARSGEALLTLCRIADGMSGPGQAASELLEYGSQIPWSAAIDGTSGRLLAVLSAASALSPEARSQASEEIIAALLQRQVALPPPIDRVEVSALGWSVHLDPWWRVLAQRLAADLGGQESASGTRWSDAMMEPTRTAKALHAFGAEIAGAPETGLWRLAAAGNDLFTAARWTTDGGIELALHSKAQIETAVSALATPSNGLAPVAFVGPGDPTAVFDAGELVGSAIRCIVTHPNPDAAAASERRKLRYLRFGLFALAGLVLLATVAAARLIDRTARLQELRATFVASVSHDLRTPLASIGLMAENLCSGFAQGREELYAQTIQRETSRLKRLVDDLLDFGRLERGLMPNVVRESVDIEAWLSEAAAAERARCGSAGCALSLELGPDLGIAELDTAALERGIANLVDNALKHGEARSIRIRALRTSAELLTIEIEDSGRGLGAGAVHEHLFRAFERQSEQEGTGLGLTIVRAIAEAHGGRATLERGPDGRGALARMEIKVSTTAA